MHLFFTEGHYMMHVTEVGIGSNSNIFYQLRCCLLWPSICCLIWAGGNKSGEVRPMKLKGFLVAALAAVVALVGVPAQADSIDFVGLTGGNATFVSGLGNALSVSGAPINFLVVGSSPLTSIPVSLGSLSFTTGAASSITNIFGLQVVLFNPGGSLSIVGGVPSLGIASGTELVTGILGGSVAALPFGISGGWTVTNVYSGLLTGLGFSDTIPIGAGSFALSFFLNEDYGTFSGGINSSNVAFKIPVPASFALLGLGLFIGSFFLRGKIRAA